METNPTASEPLPPLSNRHISELDGIRGIAIGMVFLYHCLPSAPIFHFKHSLWIGVDLFFVLSGFLITRVLIDLKNQPKRFRTFYARRSLRIFPLYFFVLIFTFTVLARHPAIQRELQAGPNVLYFFGYAFNIHLFQQGSFSSFDLLNHFWSLCVEEQVYLVWPLLVFWLPKKITPSIFCLLTAAILGFKLGVTASQWSLIQIYTSTITRLDAFGFGSIAACATLARNQTLVLGIYRFAFVVVGLLLAVLLSLTNGISLSALSSHVMYCPLLAIFFSAWIFVAAHPEDTVFICKPLLRSSFLRILGKYSYGIYVYHWMIATLVLKLRLLPFDSPNWITDFLIVTALTTICSLLSYHLLEMPFLRLKKYFPSQPGASNTKQNS